ncbi:MAG: permease-like cell division protein FtsX [bacterium]
MYIKYFAAETLSNFKRSEIWLVIAAITLVCFGFGLCLNLALNVQLSLEEIGRRTPIIVYFQENLSQKKIGPLKETILKMEGVKKVNHISSGEALKRLKENLDLPSSLESALFPDTLEVFVTKEGFSARITQFSQIALKISQLTGVKEVDYGAEVMAPLVKIDQISRLAIWGIMIVSALIVFLIVSGSIRSAVAARIKTMETIRLLGATNWFIGWPFILEGIFQAGLGSALGSISLWIVYQFGLKGLVLFPSLPFGFVFLSLNSVVFLILVSGSLGGLGGFIAIWNLLKEKGEESRGHLGISLCVLVSLGLICRVAYGENIKSYEKEMTDGQKKLESITREIEKEKDKLVKTKEKKKEIETELLRLNTDLNKGVSSSDKLGQEAKQIDTRLKKINYDIAAINQNLLKLKEMLSSSLLNVYKHRRISWVDALFGPPDLPSLLRRRSHFTRLAAQYASQQIKEFEDKKNKVYSKRADLKQSYQQVIKQKGEVEGTYWKKKQERLAKVKLLNQIAEEEKMRQDRIAQLNKASGRIGKLLVQLEEMKKKVEAKKSAQPTGSVKSLSWPVKERKILIGFGKQNHPEFKTSFINKGIDMAAAPGETIRPAAEGKVVYVGSFKGYEGVVMLDHGNNHYTVYGHLGEIGVREGEKVQLTTPLGKVGEGGQIAGQPCLHLELRVNGRAVDPGKYLQ